MEALRASLRGSALRASRAWRSAPGEARRAEHDPLEVRRTSTPSKRGSTPLEEGGQGGGRSSADAVSGGAANRERQGDLIMPPQHSRLVHGRAQRHVDIPAHGLLPSHTPTLPGVCAEGVGQSASGASCLSLSSLSLPHPHPTATNTMPPI